jgi:metallo-beta-lactamase class B
MAAPASADDPLEWSTPVKPFRIAGNVYYVGTKGLAAYLIVSKQGHPARWDHRRERPADRA